MAVTNGDVMNLGAVLTQAAIDPLALVQRTLQQALDQLAREGAMAGVPDRQPEELIATALGNRLARVIVSDRSPPSASWAPPDRRQRGVCMTYEDLVERNSVFAAAVGACDCWGEQVDCPYCGGAGVAGWVDPDDALLATYIYPAMRAAAARRPAIRAMSQVRDQRRDNGHVDPWIR
jgi:hypothetical protein